jgi:hypothetical protein
MTHKETILGRIVVILIVIIFEVCLWISLDCKIPHAAPDNYGETWQ